MEHEILFDQNGISIVIRTSGKATAAGFEDLYRALIAVPRLRPGLDVLLDNRLLDLDTVSSDDVRADSTLISSLSAQLGNGLWAIVMGSERDFGLARMWEHYTENGVKVAISVFRSVEEAEKWLKL